MRLVHLENRPLIGMLDYHGGPDQSSYVVRIYLGEYNPNTNWNPIYYASFGCGYAAEDRLLKLMENVTWTVLKYG